MANSKTTEPIVVLTFEKLRGIVSHLGGEVEDAEELWEMAGGTREREANLKAPASNEDEFREEPF